MRGSAHSKCSVPVSFYGKELRRNRTLGVVKRGFLWVGNTALSFCPTVAPFHSLSASLVTAGWSKHGHLVEQEPIRVPPQEM